MEEKEEEEKKVVRVERSCRKFCQGFKKKNIEVTEKNLQG